MVFPAGDGGGHKERIIIHRKEVNGMQNEKKPYETPEVTKVEFGADEITMENIAAETIMMGC